MRGLKALIFDVDGTLSETEEVHRAAFNAAFKAAGLDWSWDQDSYRALLAVGGGRARIEHYARGRPDGAAVLARIDELHARKTEIYAKLIDHRRALLRPGVERLIEEARSRGLKIALVTTTSVGNAEALVLANFEVAGLGYFDAIVGGDAVPARKPAPDIFLMALAALGVPARNCIAFEDSANGLAAATAAGLRCVVTPSFYSRGQDFSGAFALLSHLGDPFEAYEHLAGAGEADQMVTVGALRRWMSDDDDLRSLLTIGGRSIY